MYMKLKVTYFGGLAYSEAHEAFSMGVDVGGGVNFFLGERGCSAWTSAGASPARTSRRSAASGSVGF